MPICDFEEADQIGLVTVLPSEVNTIAATVIRIGPSNDYRFATPVRQ
jgi:hypothetical protein